ncbi:MAG: hypothetical protein V3T77_08605 [Planctomycetota bacterium]
MATWSTTPTEYLSIRATTSAQYQQSFLLVAQFPDGDQHFFHFVAPFTATLGPFDQPCQWACFGLHRDVGSNDWGPTLERVVDVKGSGVFLQYAVQEAKDCPPFDDMTVHLVKWIPQDAPFDGFVGNRELQHADLDSLGVKSEKAAQHTVEETVQQAMPDEVTPQTTVETPSEPTVEEVQTQAPVEVAEETPAEVETRVEETPAQTTPETTPKPTPPKVGTEKTTPQPTATQKPAATPATPAPSPASAQSGGDAGGSLPEWLADMTGK